MKKFTLILSSILLVASLVFVGCKKDKEEQEETPTQETTIGNFFVVEGATLIGSAMPAATSQETIDVTMNGNVIPGGSSYVSLISESAAKKILVGLKDQIGYFEIIPENQRDYEYSFVLQINQNISLPDGHDAFEVQVAIVDEAGQISQIWETSVSLLAVGTGALQVSLSFDNAKDVDLHLIEPEYLDEEGYEASFYSRHIYYGNRMSANGGELDLDSNPGCYLDYINNENITYNDSAAYVAPGTYKVYVDLFENCDPTVSTNYVVTVSFGGTLIASKAGIFQVDAPSTFNPISEEYVANNEPFLTFNIGNRGQKRVKTFEPAPLTPSAIEKMANR
jgi:hypothetical protein